MRKRVGARAQIGMHGDFLNRGLIGARMQFPSDDSRLTRSLGRVCARVGACAPGLKGFQDEESDPGGLPVAARPRRPVRVWPAPWPMFFFLNTVPTAKYTLFIHHP